jgi:hypothetical protein
VALVRAEITEDLMVSTIRVKRISELVRATSSLIIFTLMMEVILSSETSVLIRAAGRHFTEKAFHLSVVARSPSTATWVEYIRIFKTIWNKCSLI